MGSKESIPAESKGEAEQANIYILQCHGGKYYVGRSNNVKVRFDQHVRGIGSEWTKLHPPERIVEVISGDVYDEDKYTLMYMEKYGVENVRGGSYSQVKLHPATLVEIKKKLDTASNRCFKCHTKGHFARNCTIIPNKIVCTRCGYFGHTHDMCYSRRHKSGYYLGSDPNQCVIM